MTLITIKWLDACQREYEKDYVNGLESGKELLLTNVTYGKLFKVCKEVVIIEHEHTEENTTIDCTIIPRSWILTPKRLRSKITRFI